MGGYTNHNRPPVDVIALSTNTSALTAIGNDYEYAVVFSRQVEAHAAKGDIVIGITTSGNSVNVIRAMQAARKVGALAVGMTGKGGGKLVAETDLCFHAPSDCTPRIQEAHITAIHAVCELVEAALF